jgi:thymidylate synthase
MNGNIPVLSVHGRTLPEAWEKAVLECWRSGALIKTEYDKPGDPPSRDCTMMWSVEDPFAEPRIHRAFPGGLEDLEVYRQEVVDGVHDHWIAPAEGKWTYTYHQRLFDYDTGRGKVNQIDHLVDKLAEAGHSRRAQAITWNVSLDPATDDPPCLQRVWCRILEDELGTAVLNMNTHWRSRDAYKAAFMNIFALTDLQKVIAGWPGAWAGPCASAAMPTWSTASTSTAPTSTTSRASSRWSKRGASQSGPGTAPTPSRFSPRPASA